jgi:sugar lactone lactonase YvrE
MPTRSVSVRILRVITEYAIPGDRSLPEGITEDIDGAHFYVCGYGDGTIFHCSIDRPEAEVWLPAGANGCVEAIGMTCDPRGRLYVCGGSTGHVFAYDTAGRELLARHTVPGTPTLLNDMTVVGDYLYVTDSLRPVVWRFDIREALGEPEEWLDLTRQGAKEEDQHYLNGIVSTHDGATLIIAAQGTGLLWRVDVASAAAAPIDAGQAVINGDGLVFVDDVLYVCDNSEEADGTIRMWLTAVRLTDDARGAQVLGRWERALLDTPSTAAYLDGRLYLVNAQRFAHFVGKTETPPFTVSALVPPVR